MADRMWWQHGLGPFEHDEFIQENSSCLSRCLHICASFCIIHCLIGFVKYIIIVPALLCLWKVKSESPEEQMLEHKLKIMRVSSTIFRCTEVTLSVFLYVFVSTNGKKVCVCASKWECLCQVFSHDKIYLHTIYLMAKPPQIIWVI